MAEITATMVKNLREKTGAGMGECKKALVESEGDIEKAIEILRKKGAASAAKRADRNAKEGIVAAICTPDNKTGVLVEVNSETDFVAKNENFVNYANTVAKAYLENDVNSVEELLNVKVGNDTIQGLHNEVLAKFSEKIEIRRIFKVKTSGFVSVYNHFDKKLAVIVEANLANPTPEDINAIHDVALQIAAMNPISVDSSNVDQAKIDKELEIYRDIAISEGKTPQMADNIAKGKLSKFFKESCLLEQIFAKDNTITVKEMLAKVNPELKVVAFKRFYIGEEA